MLELNLDVDESPVDVGLDVGSGVELEVTSDHVVSGVSSDYRTLTNKPSIEEVELVGDRKLSDFGIGIVTNEAILNLFR